MEIQKNADNKDFLVRPLEPEDGLNIQKIFEDDHEYFLKNFGYPPGAEAQSLFSAIPEGKDYCDKFLFGLIDNAGLLVGFAEVIRDFPGSKESSLAVLYLHKKFRARGLGKHFHDFIVRFVSEHESHNIVARTGVLNTRAIGFFIRCGYTLENIHWDSSHYLCSYTLRRKV